MNRILQALFFICIVRPFALVAIGLNIRGRHRLSFDNAAIIAANHNSMLDTIAIMSLVPIKHLHRVRPIAAADYFLKNRCLRWFSTVFFNILPIERRPKRPKVDFKSGDDRKQERPNLFSEISDALNAGDIVIIYPEGTRGEPEDEICRFKRGVSILAKRHPEVATIPIFLAGFGKVLPRGAFLPVPFFCDAYVGQKIYYGGDPAAFLIQLEASIRSMKSQHHAAALE